MTTGGRKEFIPFRYDSRTRVETTQVRTSWLASSIRALRRRKLLEAYKEKLPEALHNLVLLSAAADWLPVGVAKAHYAAIDRLAITPEMAFEMGAEVQTDAQSGAMQFIRNSAKEAGVTPWTGFQHLRKLWDRTWVGGDFAVFKLGPKDAEVEIVKWSIAEYAYVRHAMRGTCERWAGMLSTRASATEVTARCSALSLCYRIAWV